MPSGHTWSNFTKTWTQGGNSISNAPTGLSGTAFATAVEHADYGNKKYDSIHYDGDNNYTSFPVNTSVNNQQQILVINVSHTTSDSDWSLRFRLFDGSSEVTSGFHTTLWWTGNAGTDWRQELNQVPNASTHNFTNNELYASNGGRPESDTAVILLFQADTSSDSAVLPKITHVRIGSLDLTYYLWVSRGALNCLLYTSDAADE